MYVYVHIYMYIYIYVCIHIFIYKVLALKPNVSTLTNLKTYGISSKATANREISRFHELACVRA